MFESKEENARVKIIDFGFAVKFEKNKHLSKTLGSVSKLIIIFRFTIWLQKF